MSACRQTQRLHSFKMSEKSFISESDSDSSDFSESELSFEEEEPEEFDEASTVSVNVNENNELEIGPYSEEPIADAEWLAEYNQRRDEQKYFCMNTPNV